jgi:hypothetical protein
MTSLERLDSFGGVAAEDEPVLDYFLQTDAVTRIESQAVFVVLGRKGSGKTALVRFFSEMKGASASKALSLRGYPWNVHAARVDRGASQMEAYVSSWRYLIALELALLVLTKADACGHPKVKAIKKFLEDNYGGLNPALGDILKPAKLRMSGSSFEPEVLGFKLGSIEFERRAGDLGLGSELNALSDMLPSAASEVATDLGIRHLLLHFDELDQGITTFDTERAQMIVGLVLAARDVRRLTQDTAVSVNPVVYLRSDLWDDLVFSDKNKISQAASLNLEWTLNALLDLINVRLAAKLGEGIRWDQISTPSLMRGSQTKWNHIIARTFLRPRDVIQFLNSALSEAKKRASSLIVLDNEDVTNARESYSLYLKKELDDEIIAHWASWEEALQVCSAISTITFRRDEFIQLYDRRKSLRNQVSADEALQLLYRFSVIGYARRSGYGGSSWAFQYTNPEAGWDNSATVFKVHLGLKEFAKLREERLG